jgi:phosphoglycolate phosphatase-like HAD superfamily hydrolase
VPASFMDRPDLYYRAAPCVFLDCDGVVFDSNGFKLEALRQTLAGYPPAAVARMEHYWSANGGVSRYRKLAHFFREIWPVPDPEAEVRLAAERFGRLSRRFFDGVAPIPGALALARDAGRERCFVVSGADGAEVRDVFAAQGISGLFAEVHGSPITKREHLERILGERGCPAERALFVGDGGGDYEACRALGLPFIYLAEFSEWTAADLVLAAAPLTHRAATWPELLALVGVRA